MDELVVSVTQLNEYISRKLYRDSLMQNIRVMGEVTNLKFHSNGSVYFSLKDSGASIPCIMFEHTDTIPYGIEDGKKVTVTASINYYTREGRLQLAVTQIALSGFGELFLQYELTKKKLFEEGLFDARHKKSLPLFPERIGVVTSASGAAMHDIIQVAKRRSPGIAIDIYPSRVQGEGAAQEVIYGIEYFNQVKNVDVIIVGRGGGSFEDLSAFNEEPVARAMFASRIPIVSAVGHEVDITLSDLAADLRAPTPSAAAELCVPDKAALKETLKGFNERLSVSVQSAVYIKKTQLEAFKNKLLMNSPEKISVTIRNELTGMKRIFEETVSALYLRKLNMLQIAKSHITALNPYDTLKRGYAIIKNKTGHAIASVQSMETGENVKIVLYDGLADAKIDKIEYNEA